VALLQASRTTPVNAPSKAPSKTPVPAVPLSTQPVATKAGGMKVLSFHSKPTKAAHNKKRKEA